MIFCRVDPKENINVQRLLNTYEKASGQKIIREKTLMVFSKNVATEVKDEVLHLWRVNSAQQYEKYLGLPPVVLSMVLFFSIRKFYFFVKKYGFVFYSSFVPKSDEILFPWSWIAFSCYPYCMVQ